ncbi:MAG: hypothetical protein SA378_11615 [Sedimentibacter sp.]|uniref:hypothetical protein n=1 Tax=Sedimentibacter sp. TaxID=1960295 RepID=UPI002981C490|nr:hypothetical protein [Sedimentibacter sp.]MDW5300763.1 hypothetical protein [Sedimentibacter sp.]
MTIAFIKNNICVNIVVFKDDTELNDFKVNYMTQSLIEDAIVLPEGFGIGDYYINGIWTKAPIVEIVIGPTIEERLILAEDMINYLLGL